MFPQILEQSFELPALPPTFRKKLVCELAFVQSFGPAMKLGTDW